MNIRRKVRFLVLCTIALTYGVMKLVPSKAPSKQGFSMVRTWSENQSRNVRDYVAEELNPHIIPEDFCAHQTFLVVVVCSRTDSFKARAAIRETWGQKRANISLIFLVGEVENDDILQERLENEHRHNGDIIQERFIDTYNNLTLKSINMLKLFNLYCAKTCKYLMKVDEDVYLNIPKIENMLIDRNSPKNLLVGKTLNNTRPFREFGHKWFVSYEWYPEKTYPDYICGATYIMSGDVADRLYRCTLDTPLFYIEDVFITGICARKMQITPQDSSRFTCTMAEDDICIHQQQLYAMHPYNPDTMRFVDKFLKENSYPT